MRIGLIPNPEKDHKFKKTLQVAGEIAMLGGKAVLDEKYRNKITMESADIEFNTYDTCSLLVCLGGDGTFLTAVHDYLKHETPIIGVNMGSVGFLAEIRPQDTLQALTQIFKGEYTTEKRMLLHTICYTHKGAEKMQAISLNDIVITRGGVSRILNIDLFIDGVLIESLPGDGLIISTPTGSTAYSLSAGGPIIQPDLEVILITPLNPHTLHNRSYIVAPHCNVEVVIKEYPFNPLLTSDGVHVCTLEQLDRIQVTKSSLTMNLVKLQCSDFYKSLATKIYSRGI
ncbi:MAG: NAD(+)/NADH kinase [Saccharofermentanales bacterium]